MIWWNSRTKKVLWTQSMYIHIWNSKIKRNIKKGLVSWLKCYPSLDSTYTTNMGMIFHFHLSLIFRFKLPHLANMFCMTHKNMFYEKLIIWYEKCLPGSFIFHGISQNRLWVWIVSTSVLCSIIFHRIG